LILLSEIIGSDKRCSNIVLNSFGLCSDKPLMRGVDLLNIFFREPNFKTEEIYLFKSNSERIIYKKGIAHIPLKYIFNVISKKGHYILLTQNHAMALHNGELVDTENRGFDGRLVYKIVEIKSPLLENRKKK